MERGPLTDGVDSLNAWKRPWFFRTGCCPLASRACVSTTPSGFDRSPGGERRNSLDVGVQ
ncbi:hypothetical protein D8S78_02220 [Natrialba swarupiae]|nr:hypothetical protein [Natrialba swarupiae]